MSLLEDAKALKEQIGIVENYIDKNNEILLQLANEVETMKVSYEQMNARRLDLKENYKIKVGK